MSQQDILSLAKQGNPKAIATIMNRSTQPQGITVKATRQDECLHVMLESAQTPNQKALVALVRNGMARLKPDLITTVKVYGRRANEKTAAWTEEIELRPVSVPALEHPVEPANQPVSLSQTVADADTATETVVEVPIVETIEEPEVLIVQSVEEPVAVAESVSEVSVVEVIEEPEVLIVQSVEEPEVVAEPASEIPIIEVIEEPEALIVQSVEEPVAVAKPPSEIPIVEVIEEPEVLVVQSVEELEAIAKPVSEVPIVEAIAEEPEILVVQSIEEPAAVVEPLSEVPLIEAIEEPEVLVVQTTENLGSEPARAIDPAETVQFSDVEAVEPDLEGQPTEPSETLVERAEVQVLTTQELLKRPEAVALIAFAVLLIFWQAYLAIVEQFDNISGVYSGRGLAHRLGVSTSTVRRRRNRADFSQWTQSLDPQGIAWVYRGNGKFVPKG